jgi:hypothetical protein
VSVSDRGALRRLARDLRAHPDKKIIVRELRRELRRPLPAVRAAVRAKARQLLPATGGLGAWVAATRIGASVSVPARSVRLRVRGGRSSVTGKRSDVSAIDRGRVRAPSWGRRGPGQWHTQAVPAEFFTATISEDFAGPWRAAAVAAAEEWSRRLAAGG